MRELLLTLVTFVSMTQCSSRSFISQPQSTVKIQPGLSTSLECHIHPDGKMLTTFWIKIPLDKAPVCIATAKSYVDKVNMYEKYKNLSRINVTRSRKSFRLSISAVEQSDAAKYVCGMLTVGQLVFGNGTKLILQEHVNGKMHVSEYLVPALAATNVASVFLIILLCYLLKKRRSASPVEARGANDNNTDELNYAALDFGYKQRRTVQKRSSVEPKVIYGVVQHQDNL